ncbi:hypothetical protein AMECASPLE_027194 [Ameca splendens]|uniref:Uncharacterized protein n=1 Tax=Ameca splendens TaxID=208324 RepID=A0ABV0YGM1_9TELE
MCLVSPSLGDECLTLALKGRCQNQLKRFQTAPQRLFGSRRVAVGILHGGTAGSRLLERAIEGFCEVHFLPLVVAVGDSSWTQRLRCVGRSAVCHNHHNISKGLFLLGFSVPCRVLLFCLNGV